MNDLILKLIKNISENEECSKSKLSFVAHDTDDKYKEHIKSWNSKLTFAESLKKVEDILSKEEKIKSFNLTLEFDQGVPKWSKEGDDLFAKDWFRCSLIFYGSNGRVNGVFDMLSSYFGLDQSHFNTFLAKPPENEDDYPDPDTQGVRIDTNFSEGIQSMIDLKNILIENGNKVITQLEKIKKLNENI